MTGKARVTAIASVALLVLGIADAVLAKPFGKGDHMPTLMVQSLQLDAKNKSAKVETATIVASKTSRPSRQPGKSRPRAKSAKRWPKSTWSYDKILRAQARCSDLLRNLDVIVKPMAPIRRNSCGSAAPMKLVAMGSNPRVTFDPAPTVSCELIAAMHRWLKRDLQPMARRHLGAPLTSIAIMSSYSCRNAYGRRRGETEPARPRQCSGH